MIRANNKDHVLRSAKDRVRANENFTARERQRLCQRTCFEIVLILPMDHSPVNPLICVSPLLRLPAFQLTAILVSIFAGNNKTMDLLHSLANDNKMARKGEKFKISDPRIDTG